MDDHPAVRQARQALDAIYARDFDAYAALIGDDFRFEDRRAGLGSTHGKTDSIEQAKAIADLSDSATVELLETRGERCAMYEVTIDAQGFEISTITLMRVDDEGRALICVVFDVTDVDAARAELDSLAAV